MHQHRAVAALVGQRGQHAVEMDLGAGTALHREAERLVQHHQVAVVEQDHVADGAGVGLGKDRLLDGRRLHALDAQRRHAHIGAGRRRGSRCPRACRSAGLRPCGRSSPDATAKACGMRRLNQRSMRMPSSSSVTSRICTFPVSLSGAGAGSSLASAAWNFSADSRARRAARAGSKASSSGAPFSDARRKSASLWARRPCRRSSCQRRSPASERRARGPCLRRRILKRRFLKPPWRGRSASAS